MNAVLCVSGDCTPFGLIWVYRPSDITSRARHLEHIPATKTIVCLVVVLPLLQVRKKTATVAELSMRVQTEWSVSRTCIEALRLSSAG